MFNFSKLEIIGCSIFTIILFIIIGSMIHTNLIVNGPIYERITIKDKIEGGKEFYRNKQNVSVKGTWVQFRNNSTNVVDSKYIENPFIAKEYEIGKTYIDSSNIVKGYSIESIILVTISGILISVLLMMIIVGVWG